MKMTTLEISIHPENDWFENDHLFYHRIEAEEMIKILDKQAREMDMK